MNESAIWAIAGLVSVLFVLMAVGLILVWRQQKRLAQETQLLHKQLQRSSDDVAGLCAAAIAVDKRLSENESHLYRMLDSLSSPQPMPDEFEVAEEAVSEGGYASAIEKIRLGASLDELVKNCGLTRDEAMLLMRLHGSH